MSKNQQSSRSIYHEFSDLIQTVKDEFDNVMEAYRTAEFIHDMKEEDKDFRKSCGHVKFKDFLGKGTRESVELSRVVPISIQQEVLRTGILQLLSDDYEDTDECYVQLLRISILYFRYFAEDLDKAFADDVMIGTIMLIRKVDRMMITKEIYGLRSESIRIKSSVRKNKQIKDGNRNGINDALDKWIKDDKISSSYLKKLEIKDIAKYIEPYWPFKSLSDRTLKKHLKTILGR